MTKRSVTTQELVNVFPAWTKIRSDEQSNGYQLLNAFGNTLEEMEKYLHTMRCNQYITTANLDEIDIIHKITLPKTYVFSSDITDPANTNYIVPTVSGYINSEWVDVFLSDKNDIKSFWYDTVPTRFALTNTVSGVDHNLMNYPSTTFPVTGCWQHHLDAGKIWIETTSGSQYLQYTDNDFYRAEIILTGYTRKKTYESETLVFPWDMVLSSQKEWREITEVKLANFEDGVNINIKSGNFNAEDHISNWNFKYSKNRNKIDEFWGLGTVSGVATLDCIQYVTDEWQQLVAGWIDKETIESWELLDENYNNIVPVDMTLQPFTDRAWVVTSDTLYCYEAFPLIVSGVELLKDKTFGSSVAIDIEFPHLIRNEYIEFIPWHARPLKEIQKYRIWYQTPSGTKYGLLYGTPVAYASDFWIKGRLEITRTVEGLIRIKATELGDYLIVFEVEYVDFTTETNKAICTVNYKLPLTTIDLTSLTSDPILGIDFDADQRMWLRTNFNYYQLSLHSDVMLVDFNNKEIYLREEYDEVKIY